MSGHRLIIVNVGLDPSEPMMDWDRKKSSVTDEDGRKVGFIDMNDGMSIHIWIEPDIVRECEHNWIDEPQIVCAHCGAFQ